VLEEAALFCKTWLLVDHHFCSAHRHHHHRHHHHQHRLLLTHQEGSLLRTLALDKEQWLMMVVVEVWCLYSTILFTSLQHNNNNNNNSNTNSRHKDAKAWAYLDHPPLFLHLLHIEDYRHLSRLLRVYDDDDLYWY